MVSSNFIPDDGYTVKGYIAPRAGLYEACRFKFRPVLYGQRIALQASVAAAKGLAAGEAVAKVIAKQISEWDQVDHKGSALAIDARNIARLKPQLVDKLYAIVCGYDASDIDQESQEPTETIDIDAIMGGTLPGEARQESNEKNS